MGYIDPTCIPDTFAEKLASVEDLGPFFRFTYVTKFGSDNLVVSRLVVPTLNIEPARIITAEVMRRSPVLFPDMERGVMRTH